MNAVSAPVRAGLHAGVHGAAITALWVAAAFAVLTVATITWRIWTTRRWPDVLEQQVRDGLTAELAEAELQDIIRRGQL